MHAARNFSNPMPCFAFTGKSPEACAGFHAHTGTLHSLPQISTTASRAELQDYFDNGWALTELLFSSLTSEAAFYARAYHKLRMPMLFYFAHPVALYVNKLRVAGILDAPVHADFESLFETGVDEMRWDNLHEDKRDWPALAEVVAYRAKVYAMISRLIAEHPAFEHMTIDSPGWALVMGFEHERIHLETSSVLLRELPLEYLARPAAWPQNAPADPAASYAPLILRTREATQVQLGKPRDFPTFGWDNEYGSETRDVPAFEASTTLVRNGDFLEFMRDGGYSTDAWWCERGLAWRRFRNSKHPTFWVPDGPSGLHAYLLRTVFETIPLPRDWPVCVNHFEASAYCRWKTARDESTQPFRLLSEGEHIALRDGSEAARANLGLRAGSESSVYAAPANSFGMHDAMGNVWQWLLDDFHPLAGSTPHPFYTDFSTPCYDGEHSMILGGSFASTGDEASPFARFHFRPHFFQHAGFRIARSLGTAAPVVRYITPAHTRYEDRYMLGRYLHLHYGEASPEHAAIALPAFENFPKACADLVHKHAPHASRILDVGCAVGRSSFELARAGAEVIAFDYAEQFIRAAKTLQSTGQIAYSLPVSGDAARHEIAYRPPEIDSARVQFELGDAMQLRPDMGQFDAILVANVICRLPNPAACLQALCGMLRPGGVLVITSPYSWLEEYTPRAHWLDGFEALAQVLPHMHCIAQQNLPLFIVDHARKFEYIVAEASVWKTA